MGVCHENSLHRSLAEVESEPSHREEGGQGQSVVEEQRWGKMKSERLPQQLHLNSEQALPLRSLPFAESAESSSLLCSLGCCLVQAVGDMAMQLS